MKAEEIRSAIDSIPQETLADALTLLLAEGKAPVQTAAGTDRPELANFAQALIYMKKNYDFPELDYFSIEADLVYVEAGGRRVLLTERMSQPVEGISQPAARAKEESGNGKPVAEGGRFSNLEI